MSPWEVTRVLGWWIDLIVSLGIVGLLAVFLLTPAIDPRWRMPLARARRALARLALATLVVGLAAGAMAAARTEGSRGADMVAWLVWHGALLAAVVWIRPGARPRRATLGVVRDGAAIALAVVGLTAAASASHAFGIAQGEWPPPAVIVAVVGAGVWIGILPWLLLALSEGGAPASPVLEPSAACVARRLSILACVGAAGLVAGGICNARSIAAVLPGLVGTSRGRLALLAPGLLAAMLAIAGRRMVLLAGRERGTSGERRRLTRLTALESALALGALLAAALSIVRPHDAGESPVWPLSVRFAPDITWSFPGVQVEVTLGATIVLLGVLTVAMAGLVRQWRPLLLLAAAILLAVGTVKAFLPLTVDAYPTTYVRSPIPATSESVARGEVLFARHCATCHGASGRGDGPAAGSLIQRPADLTGPHAREHTVGDVFWWLTNGRGLAMPAFGEQLSVQDRWDLIHFVRTLPAQEQARRDER